MKRLEACTPQQFQQMLADYPQNGFNAFTPLIHAESKWAFTTAYAILKNKEDAEEMRNESLLKWIRALNHSKDAAKLTRAYLSQIVKNTCSDLLKKRKKEAEKSIAIINGGAAEKEPYDVHCDELHEHHVKQLYDGIERLGEPCRSMMLLKLENELSQAEILEKLNIEHAPASVSGLFRNCRNRLHTLIFN
jgi:RNA polymerase sigma factor (sigma-70 family)